MQQQGDTRHASEKPEYYTFNTVNPERGGPGTEGTLVCLHKIRIMRLTCIFDGEQAHLRLVLRKLVYQNYYLCCFLSVCIWSSERSASAQKLHEPEPHVSTSFAACPAPAASPLLPRSPLILHSHPFYMKFAPCRQVLSPSSGAS
eukprot:566822-Pelagomonas_calceolata.AAC.5